MDMFPEWDEPIDEAVLQAIESSYVSRSAQLAITSAFDRARSSLAAGGGGRGSCSGRPPTGNFHGDPKTNGRRLPNWVATAAAASPSSSYPTGPTGASYAPFQHQGIIRSLPPPIDQGQVKFNYPVMTFGGYIVYSRTAYEVERSARELLETINSRKRCGNRVPIGFDIEWKPTFRKGEAPRKAAVIQLCGDKSRCYVMHVIHSGIPSILKSLLGDNSSVKVGVGISNDATKMKNDYNVHVEDLEDLSSIANRKFGGVPKRWSLKALTEKLTCKQLSKSKRIRLGNWEAKVLSKQQLLYAATDAFVSWFLYEVLAQLPDDNVKDESALPAAAAPAVDAA